jgi:hypothetical protein
MRAGPCPYEVGHFFTSRATFALGAAAAAMFAAASAKAQLPIPASTQFDVTGLIEEAILDQACTADPHCGGTIKLQGHVIAVPRELVVLLPANALTWQELFAQAPLPYGLTAGTGPASGMAEADIPAPLTSYEAHVIGNRVLGGPAGADLYIAAIIYVSQHSLSKGNGYVSFIDYAVGEMRVGGRIGDPNCAQGTSSTSALCTGARVRINDPAGRYGRINSPDVRFTVDAENPTVMAGSGFPMCLPRTDPAVADDALCPQAQRPVVAAGPPVQFLGTIQMNDPTKQLAGVPPDPFKQVPFEVGDFITFAGTVVTDDAAAPTAGPWPANGVAGTYVSAHTIVNNIAVYTFPGTNPAYVMTDVTLMGTGGLTVAGAGEAAARTRFEGMTTDPSRNVHLYGIDTAPSTGSTTDRDWGYVGVDPGPPNGAVKGRWRFRPPCLTAGSVPSKPDRQCVMNASGTFLPPPREVRAVIEGAWTPPAAGAVSPTAANGLTYGQYHAPIFEYIFPENVPATPIVSNNFNTMPFLALGGYTTGAGTVVGTLNPWPDISVPGGCQAPVASTGGPYTVASGGTVQLTGSAFGTAPFTFLWIANSGLLSDQTIPNPIFSAAGAISPVTATLTVSNSCASATVFTTITLNSALAPTVNPVLPISVAANSGALVRLSGTDPNVPSQALTFKVFQVGLLSLGNLIVVPTGASTANLTFTTPALPAGQVTPATVDLTISATNASGAMSAPVFTTVTITPVADLVAVTAAQYRTGKQRLDVTATSSVVSPNVVLKLQPYLTSTGNTFDPSTLGNTFTNTGGGIYTITLVGAPEPAIAPATPIVVRSNLGGQSFPVAITVRN